MTWTNHQTFLYRDGLAGRATAPIKRIAFVRIQAVSGSPTASCAASFEPEPSSLDVISPADAVKRYWRWNNMPETMRRLA
jgi:hypothetical protein